MVVVLVKQPSLRVGEVGVIVYVRKRERACERDGERICRGDVWLVVGCLSAPGVVGRMCFVHVFNEVSVSPYLL